MQYSGVNKILVVVVIVLLLTNLGVLYFYNRPETHGFDKEKSKNEQMADWMRKELGFNELQASKYIKLREKRDSLMMPLQAELKIAKLNFLTLLSSNNVKDSVIENASKRIAQKQIPIDIAYFWHFKRVQDLCTPEQQPLLDSMLQRMVIRSVGGGNYPSAHGKGR